MKNLTIQSPTHVNLKEEYLYNIHELAQGSGVRNQVDGPIFVSGDLWRAIRPVKPTLYSAALIPMFTFLFHKEIDPSFFYSNFNIFVNVKTGEIIYARSEDGIADHRGDFINKFIQEDLMITYQLDQIIESASHGNQISMTKLHDILISYELPLEGMGKKFEVNTAKHILKLTEDPTYEALRINLKVSPRYLNALRMYALSSVKDDQIMELKKETNEKITRLEQEKLALQNDLKTASTTFQTLTDEKSTLNDALQKMTVTSEHENEIIKKLEREVENEKEYSETLITKNLNMADNVRKFVEHNERLSKDNDRLYNVNSAFFNQLQYQNQQIHSLEGKVYTQELEIYDTKQLLTTQKHTNSNQRSEVNALCKERDRAIENYQTQTHALKQAELIEKVLRNELDEAKRLIESLAEAASIVKSTVATQTETIGNLSTDMATQTDAPTHLLSTSETQTDTATNPSSSEVAQKTTTNSSSTEQNSLDSTNDLAVTSKKKKKHRKKKKKNTQDEDDKNSEASNNEFEPELKIQTSFLSILFYEMMQFVQKPTPLYFERELLSLNAKFKKQREEGIPFVIETDDDQQMLNNAFLEEDTTPYFCFLIKKIFLNIQTLNVTFENRVSARQELDTFLDKLHVDTIKVSMDSDARLRQLDVILSVLKQTVKMALKMTCDNETKSSLLQKLEILHTQLKGKANALPTPPDVETNILLIPAAHKANTTVHLPLTLLKATIATFIVDVLPKIKPTEKDQEQPGFNLPQTLFEILAKIGNTTPDNKLEPIMDVIPTCKDLPDCVFFIMIYFFVIEELGSFSTKHESPQFNTLLTLLARIDKCHTVKLEELGGTPLQPSVRVDWQIRGLKLIPFSPYNICEGDLQSKAKGYLTLWDSLKDDERQTIYQKLTV